MSSFTDDLLLTHMANKWRLWRLERDFVYEVGELGSGKKIVVPKGFLTDGASVPRAFWMLLPPWGDYSRASVIHDYLCWRLIDDTAHPLAPTRKIADDIFHEAMLVSGTGKCAAWLIWAAVRVGAYMGKLGIGNGNIVSRWN